MAAGFVAEAEAFRVLHAGAVKEDGTGERGAADEAHVAHGFQFPGEAEGASRGDFAGVVFGGDFEVHALVANERVVEVDVTTELEGVGRDDANALALGFDGDFAANAEVAFAAAVNADAGFLDEVDEGIATAVENRDFEVVDFDVGVVDAHAVEHAEEVFGGGNEHALAHEAGGVAHTGDVTPACGDGEAIEVGTEKDDSRHGRSGKNADFDVDTVVKADAFCFNWTLDGGFKPQRRIEPDGGFQSRTVLHVGSWYQYK